MATILSQYSTTGFYKAPVSKGLMCCMFLTCTAINMPMSAHLRKYLMCKLPDILLKHEFWRLFTSRLTFLDTKDLVCGAVLIYYFRVFERRYGSFKFSSCLLATCTIATLLEILVILVMQRFQVDFHNGGIMPQGPYGLIFPLFVNYFFDIPRVAQTHIMGIPVTGKTLTYLLGLQVCSTSIATFISGLCGIVAGLAYRVNILWVHRWLVMPHWLSKLVSNTIGHLLRSTAPKETPIGATLELQRQQHMEMLEEQMIMQRARESTQHQQGQGYAERLIGPDNMWPNQNGHLFDHLLRNRRNNIDVQAAPIQPTEEKVQTLVEMGFERNRVVSALRSARDDVQIATNILLQEI